MRLFDPWHGNYSLVTAGRTFASIRSGVKDLGASIGTKRTRPCGSPISRPGAGRRARATGPSTSTARSRSGGSSICWLPTGSGTNARPGTRPGLCACVPPALSLMVRHRRAGGVAALATGLWRVLVGGPEKQEPGAFAKTPHFVSTKNLRTLGRGGCQVRDLFKRAMWTVKGRDCCWRCFKRIRRKRWHRARWHRAARHKMHRELRGGYETSELPDAG